MLSGLPNLKNGLRGRDWGLGGGSWQLVIGSWQGQLAGGHWEVGSWQLGGWQLAVGSNEAVGNETMKQLAVGSGGTAHRPTVNRHLK